MVLCSCLQSGPNLPPQAARDGSHSAVFFALLPKKDGTIFHLSQNPVCLKASPKTILAAMATFKDRKPDFMGIET